MNNPFRVAVTGANGQLGRLVIEALASRLPPGGVVALVRDPAHLSAPFPDGVEIRQGDYGRPESLDIALKDVDRLLLISSNALGARVAQHRNVIAAATQAGVKRLAYTSVLRADTSSLGLAEEHRQTEALIRASGLAYTLLRNGWYTENYAASIPAALAHGALLGAAGEGRISSAARQDYAEAAAQAMIKDTGPQVVHELAGDASYTLTEFAAEIARQAGKPVAYAHMSEADFRNALIGAGLPPPVADLLSNSDAAAAKGALFDRSSQLSRLIGRPTTPFAATIAQTLAAGG